MFFSILPNMYEKVIKSYSPICPFYFEIEAKTENKANYHMALDVHVTSREIRSPTCWRQQAHTVILGLGLSWSRDDN